MKGNRPKLLLFAPGAWIHGRRALQAALNSGFHTIFVDWHDPKIRNSSEYTFIKLPRTGYSKFRRVMSQPKATQLKDQLLAWGFKNLWKRVSPDVVHVCWIDYRATFCSRVRISPLILSAWGSDINVHFETGSDSTARAFATEALSGATLTIVDAPGMISRCEMLAGRPIPAEMLHLGVDTNHFHGGLGSERLALRSQLGLSEDDVLFSSMRALNSTYNQELILEAFAQSVAKVKRKAYLLFKTYNADPDYLQVLQQKTREYGVAERVRFVNAMPYSAMPSLYAATDVVINFPRRDSLPVTFLEAAACQREVISNKLEIYSGGMSDDNITWFSENDHLALADAITERANGYRYSEERFSRVRELVVAEFSELKYQNRIRDIYRELACLR